jgi:hypothetical protein
MKQIEFTSKNVKPFTSWLKRFSSIDTSLLLEIDEKDSKFLAKSYDEQRSIVKYSEISFADAGFVVKKKEAKRIKAGIYNISRLMKIMDMYTNTEFSCVFNYDEILSGENKDYAATSIKLLNKDLKMTVECTSLNIFKYISDELFTGTIAAIDQVITFNLSRELMNKVYTLCILDNDDKYMSFFSKNSSVFVKGKSFEQLLYTDAVEGNLEDTKLDISKEQFEKLDDENYVIAIGEDRMVFTSTDSITTSVISMVERDENYDGKEESE